MIEQQIKQIRQTATAAYLRHRQRQVRGVVVLLIASIFFSFIGIGTIVADDVMTTKQYKKLTAIAAGTDYAEKVRTYKKAIALCPSEPRAYELLLESYESNGQFGKEESTEFLSLYNANKTEFDNTEASIYALYYKIGRMYFCMYTENGEPAPLSAKVQKAYPFFREGVVANKKHIAHPYKDLCECYYNICDYYKSYILDGVDIKEITQESVAILFCQIDSAYVSIQTADSFDQLVLYNSVMNLIYDRRTDLAQIGYSQSAVQALLTRTAQAAQALVVQKETSKQLQAVIMANSNEYSNAVARAYQSVEGSDGP